MILINGILDLYCGGLGLMMLLANISAKKQISRATLISRLLLVVATVMLVSEGSALCFLHNRRELRTLYGGLTALSFGAFYILVGFYFRYLVVVLRLERSTLLHWLYGLNIGFCAMGAGLWFINCFTPYFYDIQSLEITNQILYRISMLPGILSVAVDLALILRNARQMEKIDMVLLLLIPTLPMISSIIGQIIPGLSLQYALILAGLVLNHLYFDEVQDRELAQKNQELQEMRLRMTLERVKPHYIYNVLASIYYLCETDSAKAQYAVGVFSDYLRQALRSMELETRVPFSKELNMVENYLKLEQLRFGDRISVSYDVTQRDFLIPPFTVQPLVENAVKHGMGDQDRVHIRIESKKTPEGCLVTVRDDGQGYDREQVPAEEPSGLRNIRQLLSFRDTGTLTITSARGQGTTASILFKCQP